jgi:hypothetical protein
MSLSNDFQTQGQPRYHDSAKARTIQQLRQEAADLRQKQRDYRALQDQMLALEQAFSRLNEEKRLMEEEYTERVDSNIRLIQTLRAEIDEQVMVHDERRHQNCDLQVELDRQKNTI